MDDDAQLSYPGADIDRFLRAKIWQAEHADLAEEIDRVMEEVSDD